MKTKKILSVLVCSAFALIFIVFRSDPVSANAWPAKSAWGLTHSTCPLGSEQYRAIARLKNEIAASGTVTEAKAMALAPTEGAITALKNAHSILPFSDDLRIAETRLQDVRARILMASSQEQVADEFSGMMLVGLDNDRAAHISVGKVGCDYSTGEIIAVVIGLILGIIPGLILLVVLC